jgi:hypothetical protein
MAKEFIAKDNDITIDENVINIKRRGSIFRPVRESLSIPIRTITNVHVHTPFTIFGGVGKVVFNTIDGQTYTLEGLSNINAREIQKLLTR